MNVYDFDNTIYHGESGMHMFWHYIKRRPSLVRHAPKVIKGVIDYKANRVGIDDVMGRVGEVLTSCIEEAAGDFAADAREFWDKHERRIRPFYYKLHQPDDLIISAGPEQSLREICGRLGVARYIGTVINEETKQLEFVCFRENKVKAFRERYPGQEIENFYTDSMNDKPLMDIARHVFLVKKGKVVQLK